MPHIFNAQEIQNQIREEQIKRLIPEGNRLLTVLSAEQRDSDYGGYFLLNVKDKEAGKESKVFISLAAGAHDKFKASCECFGIMDKYDLGTVDSMDYVGKQGTCKIVHEESKNRDFGLQSKVEEFLSGDFEEEKPFDDDLPF